MGAPTHGNPLARKLLAAIVVWLIEVRIFLCWARWNFAAEWCVTRVVLNGNRPSGYWFCGLMKTEAERNNEDPIKR